MQSHLDGLVCILIVHVVDDVQSHDVGLGQPFESLLIVGLDLLVIQGAVGFRLNRLDNALVDDLHARHLVAAAVDGVQQSLGGVHTSCEELHLLATRIGETQHAMAASSPQWERISLSDSYWIAEVSMEILAQKRL